jgi:hypothetical protein
VPVLHSGLSQLQRRRQAVVTVKAVTWRGAALHVVEVGGASMAGQRGGHPHQSRPWHPARWHATVKPVQDGGKASLAVADDEQHGWPRLLLDGTVLQNADDSGGLTAPGASPQPLEAGLIR